jgi:hypothetical protein
MGHHGVHRGNFTAIQVSTRLFSRRNAMAVKRMFTIDTCPLYVRFKTSWYFTIAKTLTC